MRPLSVALVLLLASLCGAHAEEPAFHAGFARVTVQDAVSFEALVAYPTEATEVPTRVGAFTIAASRDAPVNRNDAAAAATMSNDRRRSAGSKTSQTSMNSSAPVA